MKAISASSRAAGGLDPELSDNAVVHLSMALSIGLAMLDPVATHRPTPLEWDAMIARIGAAVAPSELLLQPAYEVSERWRVRVDIPDRPGGMARIIRALGALHVYTVSLGRGRLRPGHPDHRPGPDRPAARVGRGHPGRRRVGRGARPHHGRFTGCRP